MSSDFRSVDSYHRRRQLEFFRQYDNPYYAVTVHFDVTAVRRFAVENGYSTYFNLCYVFTHAAQQVEDFRYRIVDEQLVLFDKLNMSATIPTVDGPYGFARFRYNDDIHAANAEAKEIMAVASREMLLEDRPAEANHIFFSALPKVSFSALTHVTPNSNTAGEPRISFGRFEESSKTLRVPAGIMVNHVFIDGGALGDLVEHVQAAYNGL